MFTYALLNNDICDTLHGINWYEHLRKFQDVKDPTRLRLSSWVYFVASSFNCYRGVHCDLHNESSHIMGENGRFF